MSVLPTLEALAQGGLAEHSVQRLEDLVSPPANDLILACVSLPLMDNSAYPDLWRVILAAVSPCGALAVDLFGTNDDWA